MKPNAVTIDHPKLIDLLQRAYSAEKAAAFAYIGHAGSIRNGDEKRTIHQIENDEWEHRKEVLTIMQEYNIPINRWYEFQYYVIGKMIAISCYIIGWFMPYYFAGRLESGNVCEYFIMMQYFHELNIRKHDKALFDMGIKEKEHEVYFLRQIQHSIWLPVFEKLFNWGKKSSYNDVNLQDIKPIDESDIYCKRK